jgi:hypothetical protein
MREERGITREAAKAFMAQLQDVFESGAESATVSLMDTRLLLAKASDGGFTLHPPDRPPETDRLFPPTPTPPEGYPGELPFVPDEPVSVSHPVRDATVLLWLAPRDPAGVIESLADRSVSEGWIPLPEEPLGEAVTRRSYEKAGARRTLVESSEGMVTFIQRKVP